MRLASSETESEVDEICHRLDHALGAADEGLRAQFPHKGITRPSHCEIVAANDWIENALLQVRHLQTATGLLRESARTGARPTYARFLHPVALLSDAQCHIETCMRAEGWPNRRPTAHLAKAHVCLGAVEVLVKSQLAWILD